MWLPVTPSNPAVLIGPSVLFVFSVGFIGAWALTRKRRYLLLLSAACSLFFVGAIVQVFSWPPDTQLNVVVSTAFYTASVLAAAEGLLRRSGQTLGPRVHIAIFAVLMGSMSYFSYAYPSLHARIYIQNISYGALFCFVAFRTRRLAKGKTVDRLLFWTLLVFAIHFFPRTFLTATADLPTAAREFAHSPFWVVLHFSVAVLGVALALAVLGATISDLMEELRWERDVDPLTGVFNRRGFEHKASALLAERNAPVCAIVSDIDQFKRINDRFGHTAGDRVLVAYSELLQSNIRKGDVVGRLGGEEFAIILRGFDSEQAYQLAERIRLAVVSLRASGGEEVSNLSSSFGVAQRRAGESLWELITRADESLYEAKRAGRNRAVLSPLALDGAGA